MKGSINCKRGLRKIWGKNPISMENRVTRQTMTICQTYSFGLTKPVKDEVSESVMSSVWDSRRVKSAIHANPSAIRGV